jgi:hypothetical protein
MIDFPKYAQIKDRYCVCYFGQSDEYVLQLALLKPLIESKYQGLKLYLGCKDETVDKLKLDQAQILKLSDLRSRRLEFGHMREIKFDGKNHPIEVFAKECDLPNYAVCQKIQDEKTIRCVIITQGAYPTVSLNQNQTDYLVKITKQLGFSPEINTTIENSGLVIGVESFDLFKAASQGIETKLISTGLGSNLYSMMFPHGEILKI